MKHDPLADLTPAMRAALTACARAVLLRTCGGWRSMGQPTALHHPATVEALVKRALIKKQTTPVITGEAILTPKGKALAHELARRANVRRKLEAERKAA